MTTEPSHARLIARIDELETTLKRRTTEWNNTANALSDWVSIIDLDYRIVRSNRAVENFLGVRPQDAIGRHCYELVHDTGAPIRQCPIPRMVQSRQRAQTEVPLAGGCWLAITADPLTDKAGKLIGAVHMVRDISALKAAQAERETLIRELEQTLAEVKTLKGLIPICANCRRIRDDSGAWSPLEAFVRNNFDADISHGICPACAAREMEAFDL
jgi:PAS domain S-box-containing protein